ncbi:hypothetical protein JO972_11045 [Verrucomicrobiaceae bacterium 5K15]|uniref:Uncharacterized protein n=1 Tax=Oceaniferula flava TaxID=2800421 RepID=A0AAE2SC65_9BACT|nr:hypothetical protein [Oceaniferula flavus]MBK1855496.1 hypothetical protein [Oceaniferula flavus]MBM1136802.1 hypothetical protein [Oceaniferula flavus]
MIYSHPSAQGRGSQLRNRPAFVLIATVSVMVLLVMIAMAMLSMATLEQRTSGESQALISARANARMGLMLALAELQKAAGPDQRITANASIDENNTAQAHLLGVWRSFKPSNNDTNAISYSAQKTGDFIQWLSSTTPENQSNLAYATKSPEDSVILVGEGTLPMPYGNVPESQYVRASTVDVADLGQGGSGKYAWHIFDESQKANLTIGRPSPETEAERVAALGTTGRSGFHALADSDDSYAPLSDITSDEQARLVTLGSSALVGSGSKFDPKEGKAFHFLSADSKSLLTNVAEGGYQKDLSLLFDDEALPAEYADRYIYSDSETPIAAAPGRFSGAEPMPSPDPKWSQLHSHYQLYQKVSVDNGAVGIAASDDERELDSGYFDRQQLQPVISNAQFIFSMAPQEHSLADPYVGFLGLWVDLVVTVWNPYNVELRFDAMELEFYRFPLQVEFFREDESGVKSASSGKPVHIAYMFNRGNNPTGVENVQDKLPYRARITGPSDAKGVNDIVLKPGEYKVFGAPKGTTYNHKNWNYTKGLVLEEGFNPRSGGVFERYISTDENYNAQCPWPNANSNKSQIQVKLGDVYSVRVSPAKVQRTGSLWPETNNKEIVSYLKMYRGDGGSDSNVSDVDAFASTLDENRIQIGAIEIDLPDETSMEAKLPSFDTNQMSRMTVTGANLKPQGDASEKVPFLIASLRLKTEQDSDTVAGSPNGSMWLHNGITNPYFSMGIDQDEHERFHQYELTWEPMTSWDQVPAVEVDSQNRGYGAGGVTSGTGVNYAPYAQIPLIPSTSLAQFSHAPLNSGGQAPLTTQIVGNAFNAPIMPLSEKATSGSLGTHLDHSYLANNTLFDGYFLSTAATEGGPLFGNAPRDLNTVIAEFFEDGKALANPNFEPATSMTPSVSSSDYATFAQYLYNRGAFNVNSTTVEAWALFLASGTNESLPILDVLTANSTLADVAESPDAVVSRFSPMIGDEVAADFDDQSRWAGHRRLSHEQILTLAEHAVAEVKKRGPFQSVAEFVNRQLVNDPATANAGALQTAIENAELNSDFGLPTARNNNELTSGNFTAHSSDGAATQITQADLLRRLAPSLTVRGDTFRIRSYGEAEHDGTQVKVWCEAVVQRQHAFVDDSQAPTTATAALNATNQSYGRRFEIISFRWLAADEV